MCLWSLKKGVGSGVEFGYRGTDPGIRIRTKITRIANIGTVLGICYFADAYRCTVHPMHWGIIPPSRPIPENSLFQMCFLHILAQISMQRVWRLVCNIRTYSCFLEYNFVWHKYFRPGPGDGVQAPLPRGVGHHRGHVHPDIQGAAWPLPGREGLQYSRKLCCGSRMFIPDPTFFHLGSEFFSSRIPDPHQRI